MTPGVLLRVPRWGWMVIGLAIGLAVAYARQQSWSGDFGSRYGLKLNDRARFEAALVREIDGQRAFRDLVVYPETVSSSGGRRKTQLHVVAGKLRGALRAGEENAGAEILQEWRAVYFVCEPPYSATMPTVVFYLDSLGSRGVSYRLAWWRRPLYWNGLHAGMAFIVIGVLWPSLINLLAFGSLTRPAAEPLALLPLSSYAGANPAAAQPSGAERDAAVAQYTEGLEQSLSEGASESACSPGAAAEPAQAAAALSSAPLAAATSADAPQDHKSFGADQEDYYPTELKATHAPATTTSGTPSRR